MDTRETRRKHDTFGATLACLRHALAVQLSAVGLVFKFGEVEVIGRERLELEQEVRRLTDYLSETTFLRQRI